MIRKRLPFTVELMNKTIAQAFARGRVCRQTADHFEISLEQALDVLGEIDQWRTPTSELQLCEEEEEEEAVA